MNAKPPARKGKKRRGTFWVFASRYMGPRPYLMARANKRDLERARRNHVECGRKCGPIIRVEVELPS
jgi:hypothetical protein